MARVTYVQPDGSEKTCTNFEGMAVMHLAIGNLVDGIDALCGGVRQCGTCHVYVDDAWIERVGPPGEDEAVMLDALADFIEVTPGSRLSCQIHITEELDGLRVHIPKETAWNLNGFRAETGAAFAALLLSAHTPPKGGV